MTVRRGATACTPIPEGAVVSGRDPVTHLPVVSLDGARREPTTEMLAGVALMFDVEGAVLRAHHDWLTRRKAAARKGVPNVLSWFASCCEFRRMIVIEQCTRTGPADRHVEIVEREGIEHPDSMCDALAAIAERSAPPESAGAFATVLGWDAVLYVAGDIEAPAVALPRSLVGGTVVVTVLYLLLSQRLRQWSVAFSPVDFAGTGAMDGRRVPEVAAALS